MNTKEMIEVMQAFVDGKKIEVRDKGCPSSWDSATTPTWNWYEQEYRVAPEPKKEDHTGTSSLCTPVFIGPYLEHLLPCCL